ncbi:hypothetical protein ACW73L_19725 [Methylolobus aquaticus]
MCQGRLVAALRSTFGAWPSSYLKRRAAAIRRKEGTIRCAGRSKRKFPYFVEFLMWPLFRRQKSASADLESNDSGQFASRRPLKFGQIVEGMGDFSDLRAHDVALKFWLPEPVADALAELCKRNAESMSESLRQFFALHCYGLYAFHLMNDRYPGLFRDPEMPWFSAGTTEDSPGKKRIDTYWVPELGKNVMPIKVWIPNRLRRDLQGLSDHTGIKLSQYVREIVISRLLGHGTLPKRPEMLTAAPLSSAEDWCEDREVPMRQVEVEEYGRNQEGTVLTEWIDV